MQEYKGQVVSAKLQARVQRFQTSDIPVFLLTSQVGGLGLTLTAANRVVIVVRPGLPGPEPGLHAHSDVRNAHCRTTKRHCIALASIQYKVV